MKTFAIGTIISTYYNYWISVNLYNYHEYTQLFEGIRHASPCDMHTNIPTISVEHTTDSLYDAVWLIQHLEIHGGANGGWTPCII